MTNQFALSELTCIKWFECAIHLNKCFIKADNGKTITIASRKDDVYETNFTKVYGVDAANLVQFPLGDGALKLWHCRLGHMNIRDVHMLQNMMININLGKNKIASHT